MKMLKELANKAQAQAKATGDSEAKVINFKPSEKPTLEVSQEKIKNDKKIN